MIASALSAAVLGLDVAVAAFGSGAPRDGQIVVHVAAGPIGRGMMLVRPDDASVAPLPPVLMNARQLAFSPDGSKAVVSSGFDLFVVARRSGRILRRLTRTKALEIDPSWAPDARTVIYVRTSRNLRRSEIRAVRSDGGADHRLLGPSPASVDYYRFPQWAPDHSVVAYVRNSAIVIQQHVEMRSDLYLMTAGAKPMRRLTSDGDVGGTDATGSFSWSPDGRAIAFARFPSGSGTAESNRGSRIYIVNRDGSGEVPLPVPAVAATGDFNPVFAPTGDYIAFARADLHTTKASASLYVARTRGEGVTKILDYSVAGARTVPVGWLRAAP